MPAPLPDQAPLFDLGDVSRKPVPQPEPSVYDGPLFPPPSPSSPFASFFGCSFAIQCRCGIKRKPYAEMRIPPHLELGQLRLTCSICRQPPSRITVRWEWGRQFGVEWPDTDLTDFIRSARKEAA